MVVSFFRFFFFNDTAPTEIYTLSLHDALPICQWSPSSCSRYPSECRAPAASRPPNIAVPYDPDTSPPPCSPVPSRNRHTSFGGLPYAPPVSRTRTCTPSGTSRVVRLTTPPSAAEP